jgi:hypothetical protein
MVGGKKFPLFPLKSMFIFENNRYAKSAAGQVGVIPENYVQALADPPEPNEPPPPLSTFSNPNNHYPNLDGIHSNNNTSRTSTPSSYPPPPYDHQYMNPAPSNNWPAQPSSPLTNVR